MPFPNPATQFRPGQSGNPNGRPPRKRLTEVLTALIEERDAARELARVWLDRALAGDPAFFRELLNRIEGLSERAEPSGPVEVIVRYADRGLAPPPPDADPT